MTHRILVLILLLALAVGSISYFAGQRDAAMHALTAPAPYSQASFTAWLSEDPARGEDFAEFTEYLGEHGVSGVVPNWQLLRTDANLARKCERPQFMLPPREKWGNIVPPLEILRDHVVPTLGDLEVVSSYRTYGFNECIGGAVHSRHLDFHALDLIAPGQPDNHALIRELCQLQQALGPHSKMGLGAYFNPESPDRAGRFHIDMTGYRSWGYSKGADSSGCKLLL
jgi:hypothetical protein